MSPLACLVDDSRRRGQLPTSCSNCDLFVELLDRLLLHARLGGDSRRLGQLLDENRNCYVHEWRRMAPAVGMRATVSRRSVLLA